jgi:glycosyltransferase involved in cell wall biosynthesis
MKTTEPSPPIKIIFDAVPVANATLTGVGKTTKGLIEALAHSYPDELELVGHYFSFLGKNDHIDLPTAPNIRYRRSRLVPGKVYNMLRRLRVPVPYELLTKERADFHLFPGFLGWPSLLRTPSATFFHDITYITNPEYVSGPNCYDLTRLMPGVVERASFVITNSESSKRGIIDAYGTPSDKIVVEHIPTVDTVQITQTDADTRIKKLGITGPYLLFFGTLEPRKNLVGLMQAYEKLPDDLRQKYTLVITGKKGWKDEEILVTLERLRRSGAHILQTGYVSDEDRAALFMNTALYLMPSHYEGFGMQLLEGMTYGCPMLVSDIPVLREVAGDAARYCATDPDSIAKAITTLLSDKRAQQLLVAAGRKRLQYFSWDKVAQDVYAKIVESIKTAH